MLTSPPANAAFGLRRWLLPLYLGLALAVVDGLHRLELLGAEPPAVLAAALGLVIAAEVVRWAAGVLRRVFWRIRYKLIASYLLIAVAPLAAASVLAVVVGYLLVGQFMASLAAREIYTVADELTRVREALAGRIETLPVDDDGGLGVVRRLGTELPGLGEELRLFTRRYPSAYAFVVVEDKKLGQSWSFIPAGFAMPAQLEPRLPSWWDDVERTELAVGPGGGLEIKSAELVSRRDERIYLELTVPVDDKTLGTVGNLVGADLKTIAPGEVRGGPYELTMDLEAASPPMARPAAGTGFVGSLAVFGISMIDARDWSDGARLPAARLLVARSPVLGLASFAASSAVENRALILTLVFLVLAVLLVLELLALQLGLYLARSITGSIHELFVGTARFEAGDLEYRIPVAGRDQLGDLARSFNRMALSVKRLVAEEGEKERLEEELRIGRQIQQSLLPSRGISRPGLEVAALSIPAREVGGDYYDALELDDGCLLLLVADVSGKGTSAAFYMAELKGIMLTLARRHSRPAEILCEANTILLGSLDRRSFVTMTVAVLDRARGRLVLARAGHCPVLRLASGAEVAEELRPAGLGLGLAPSARFAELVEEVEVGLGEGDVFVFYTDGVSEATAPGGALFGDERLKRIVAAHRDAPARELRDAVLKEVRDFAGGAGLSDDVTLIVMRVTAQ